MAISARNAVKPGLFQRAQTAIRVFRASGQWQPQTIDNLDQWLDLRMAGGSGGTLHMITGEIALNFTAYFSGVQQISQTIGSCETELYKRTGSRAKEVYSYHPAHYLITKKANPYMNAYQWKEVMQHHAITWGNGYSFIQRDSNLNPRALWPLWPMNTRIEIEDDGRPVYVYLNPKTHKDVIYQWDDVFHLAGFGFDGLEGYSLIRLHAKALDLGLTQQDFNINFIANGIHSSGVLQHPKQISEKAAENLKKSIVEEKAGLANAGKFFVLEEGMTYSPLTMPLKDAEFLGSRVFQIQEMARILNMPPHKLKEMSQATYSNIEHLQIEYVTDTIRPWAERWEICLDTQLLNINQQNRLFFEFDLNAINRGDMRTQYEAYRAARYGGWSNANEIRYKLGDNPIENEEIGERYWQPVNMIDAASDQAAGKKPQPEQPAGGEEDGEKDEVVQDPSEK